MKDKPFIMLGFRVERSTYFELKKAVTKSGQTTSEYLRQILNEKILEQNERSTTR